MLHGNKKYLKVTVYCTIWAVMLLLLLAAWRSTAFCDWYISHIFPVWVSTYGRLTGIFPFSVGEWMILFGVGLLLFTACVWIAFAISTVIRKLRRGKPGRLAQFTRAYSKVFARIFLGVAAVMILNCFMLYHASTFSETYFGEVADDYSGEELIAAYNYVTAQCNELSLLMERDGQGYPVYYGDMGAETVRAMQKLGETYKQLAGYYPKPKAMFFSDFMCQQHMQGYYFPFSMEANYNDVMHISRKPATMCHELAHLRGYIYEDEANFIGFLAGIQSEDTFFQYSGYLSVYYYLRNDCISLCKKQPEHYSADMLQAPNAAVQSDLVFVSDEDWERINNTALFDTEKVDKASDVFVDTNLKVNGVRDGALSYNRVVKLVLQYFRQENMEF